MLTLITLPILLALLGGYAYFKSFFVLEITHNEGIVFERRYQIPFRTTIAIALKHNGDYAKFYNARKDISTAQKLDYLAKGLSADLQELQKFNFLPRDAAYQWNAADTNFTYEKEMSGQVVDMDELAKSIFENLAPKTKVSLPCKPIAPARRLLDVKKSTALQGFYSTNYSSSAQARKHNISVAAGRLNGAVISPGEALSFNKVVGDRTSANGFMLSIIISDGKFVPGTGGGVCQVSTTLYNACLRAGLTIDYAKPHSLPVSYVPPSCDAMVSRTNDLVIKNPTDSHFFLKTKADGSTLSIFVYGADTSGGKVFNIKSTIERRIESNQYEEIIDNSGKLQPGERKVIKAPKAGLVSSAYMEYYCNGVLVETKRLRQDYYSPQKGIVAVSPYAKSDLDEREVEIANICS